MKFTLALAAVTVSLSAVPSYASEGSYIGAGVTFGDNVSEETVLVRYDIPGSPASIRGQYTSFEKPEVSLSATYDSSVGVYAGVGVATRLSESNGLLTEEADGDAIAFVQLGYERDLGDSGVFGIDYKRSLADDTYAITGFAGLKF